MGRNTNRRQLFNLSQAKSYMQTMLVASGATQLIEQGKTTSIRGLYYLLETHDRRHQGRDVRRSSRMRPGDRGLRGAVEQSPRGVALYARRRATWSATSCWSTAATRSTARTWARAATASRRSSSRT